MAVYKPGRPTKYNPATGEGNKPPARPGEYRIRDGEGNLTYIGETSNLERRMKEHVRNGKMSNGRNEGGTFEYKVADGRYSTSTRRDHERSKINQHNPSMNLSSGGEGRIPDRKKKVI